MLEPILEEKEITTKQRGYSEKSYANLLPHQYKKGQSGNPSGRPLGTKSLKQYAKEMLASMTDEEREDFLHGLPKEVIWKQAEGMPDTKNDITTNGKDIVINPINYANIVAPQVPAKDLPTTTP